MAKKDRTGNRKSRDQRRNTRVPELGYYLIVTDTEGTERCYFDGLHSELPKEIQDKLVVKVVETKTARLIDKCIEFTAYDPQYRNSWIVFDRDQVKDFDEIIAEAKKKDINVGWSNPCFEIWMHAYYGSMPNIQESWTCCDRFGQLFKSKTGNNYDKALKIAEQKYKQCIDAVDENGVEFDVEVQRNTKGSHIRRSRFHQSMMDSRLLKKNQDFKELKDTL